MNQEISPHKKLIFASERSSEKRIFGLTEPQLASSFSVSTPNSPRLRAGQSSSPAQSTHAILFSKTKVSWNQVADLTEANQLISVLNDNIKQLTFTITKLQDQCAEHLKTIVGLRQLHAQEKVVLEDKILALKHEINYKLATIAKDSAADKSKKGLPSFSLVDPKIEEFKNFSNTFKKLGKGKLQLETYGKDATSPNKPLGLSNLMEVDLNDVSPLVPNNSKCESGCRNPFEKYIQKPTIPEEEEVVETKRLESRTISLNASAIELPISEVPLNHLVEVCKSIRMTPEQRRTMKDLFEGKLQQLPTTPIKQEVNNSSVNFESMLKALMLIKESVYRPTANPLKLNLMEDKLMLTPDQRKMTILEGQASMQIPLFVSPKQKSSHQDESQLLSATPKSPRSQINEQEAPVVAIQPAINNASNSSDDKTRPIQYFANQVSVESRYIATPGMQSEKRKPHESGSGSTGQEKIQQMVRGLQALIDNYGSGYVTQFHFSASKPPKSNSKKRQDSSQLNIPRTEDKSPQVQTVETAQQYSTYKPPLTQQDIEQDNFNTDQLILNFTNVLYRDYLRSNRSNPVSEDMFRRLCLEELQVTISRIMAMRNQPPAPTPSPAPKQSTPQQKRKTQDQRLVAAAPLGDTSGNSQSLLDQKQKSQEFSWIFEQLRGHMVKLTSEMTALQQTHEEELKREAAITQTIREEYSKKQAYHSEQMRLLENKLTALTIQLRAKEQQLGQMQHDNSMYIGQITEAMRSLNQRLEETQRRYEQAVQNQSQELSILKQREREALNDVKRANEDLRKTLDWRTQRFNIEIKEKNDRIEELESQLLQVNLYSQQLGAALDRAMRQQEGEQQPNQQLEEQVVETKPHRPIPEAGSANNSPMNLKMDYIYRGNQSPSNYELQKSPMLDKQAQYLSEMGLNFDNSHSAFKNARHLRQESSVILKNSETLPQQFKHNQDHEEQNRNNQGHANYQWECRELMSRCRQKDDQIVKLSAHIKRQQLVISAMREQTERSLPRLRKEIISLAQQHQQVKRRDQEQMQNERQQRIQRISQQVLDEVRPHSQHVSVIEQEQQQPSNMSSDQKPSSKSSPVKAIDSTDLRARIMQLQSKLFEARQQVQHKNDEIEALRIRNRNDLNLLKAQCDRLQQQLNSIVINQLGERVLDPEAHQESLERIVLQQYHDIRTMIQFCRDYDQKYIFLKNYMYNFVKVNDIQEFKELSERYTKSNYITDTIIKLDSRDKEQVTTVKKESELLDMNKGTKSQSSGLADQLCHGGITSAEAVEVVAATHSISKSIALNRDPKVSEFGVDAMQSSSATVS